MLYIYKYYVNNNIGDIMFKSYKIINGELYLYIDEDYEFSSELLSNIGKNIDNVHDKIKNYINKTNINFKKGIVYLVAGGVLISSIPFNNNFEKEINTEVLTNTKPLISLVDIFEKEDSFNKEDINEVIDKVYFDGNTVITDTTNSITDSVDNKINSNIIINNDSNTVVSNNQNESNNVVSNPETNATTNVDLEVPKTPINNVEEVIEETPVVSEQMVVVYRSNGTILEITLTDYLIGVVGAEMPASFNIEAIKAQAVAARTYTLKRVLNNQVLTDTTINQKYEDVSTLKSKWGSDFDKYYNKIKEAVISTDKEVITYNGNYIDAIYHSTSNGKTEDSIYVWGNEYAYLKSVDSTYDISASSYSRTVFISYESLTNSFGMTIDSNTNFNIIMRTSNNSVNQIEINGNMYSGKYVRELLGLRSTDFSITKEETGVSISTKGYGHGVGMSQYGANGMANAGYNYKEILTHYYTGVQIVK